MTKTDQIKNRYNRIAGYYDLFDKPMESSMFSKARELLTGKVSGKTLKVGVGTGKNIPYYSREVELTSIDFSSKRPEFFNSLLE